MIVESGKALFTAEDCQNMAVRNHTDSEVKENLSGFAERSLPRRIVLLVAFLVSLIFAVSCGSDSYSFFASIAAILFAVGFLLSETLYRLNRKNASSCAFIEIVVDQKKEPETEYRNSATTGPESTRFYPVFGRDTTTNYGSTWYLSKEVYRNAKEGEAVQINI